MRRAARSFVKGTAVPWRRRDTAGGFESQAAVPGAAAARLSDVESHAAERTAQLIGKIAILYGDRLEDGPNERDDVSDVFQKLDAERVVHDHLPAQVP